MPLLGRKLAEGFVDDVTVLQFGANATESKALQCRNIVLDEGERVGCRDGCEDSEGAHLVSEAIYRPRGGLWHTITGWTKANTPLAVRP